MTLARFYLIQGVWLIQVLENCTMILNSVTASRISTSGPSSGCEQAIQYRCATSTVTVTDTVTQHTIYRENGFEV